MKEADHMDVDSVYHFSKDSDRYDEPMNGEVEGLQLGWPDPIPLPDLKGKPQVLSLNELPASIQAWCVDVTERAGIDLTAFSAVAICGFGNILGRKAMISPFVNTGWIVTLGNLWTAVVGGPGTKKSSIFREALSPISILESKARDVYFVEEKTRSLKREIQERKKSALFTKISCSKEDSISPEDEERLKRLIDEIAKLTVPEPRRVVNDITYEKLIELLSENPNGLLLYCDELTSWLAALEKKGQEPARSFYLSAHGGQNRFTQDRIGRGSVEVRNVFLNVAGGIQDGPMQRLFRSADSGSSKDDGLIQRFQLLVNLSRESSQFIKDRAPDQAAFNRTLDLVSALNSLEFIRGNNDASPLVFRFDQSAQEKFTSWHSSHEHDLFSLELNPTYRAYLAKNPPTVAALALLFQVIDWASEYLDKGNQSPKNQLDCTVGLPALEKALAWLQIMRSHWAYFLQDVSEPNVKKAWTILELFRARVVDNGCTVRELYRLGRKGLTRLEDVKGPLELLRDHHFLSIENTAKNRPNQVIQINPKAWILYPLKFQEKH